MFHAKYVVWKFRIKTLLSAKTPPRKIKQIKESFYAEILFKAFSESIKKEDKILRHFLQRENKRCNKFKIAVRITFSSNNGNKEDIETFSFFLVHFFVLIIH